MLGQFLLENWQGVAMIIGGVVAWFFKIPLSKWVLRQSQADVRATEVNTDTNTINNLEKGLNIYIAIIDNIEKQLREKDEKIEELKLEIEELRNRLNNHLNGKI